MGPEDTKSRPDLILATLFRIVTDGVGPLHHLSMLIQREPPTQEQPGCKHGVTVWIRLMVNEWSRTPGYKS